MKFEIIGRPLSPWFPELDGRNIGDRIELDESAAEPMLAEGAVQAVKEQKSEPRKSAKTNR
jgi:hypothetical protein